MTASGRIGLFLLVSIFCPTAALCGELGVQYADNLQLCAQLQEKYQQCQTSWANIGGGASGQAGAFKQCMDLYSSALQGAACLVQAPNVNGTTSNDSFAYANVARATAAMLQHDYLLAALAYDDAAAQYQSDGNTNAAQVMNNNSKYARCQYFRSIIVTESQTDLKSALADSIALQGGSGSPQAGLCSESSDDTKWLQQNIERLKTALSGSNTNQGSSDCPPNQYKMLPPATQTYAGKAFICVPYGQGRPSRQPAPNPGDLSSDNPFSSISAQ